MELKNPIKFQGRCKTCCFAGEDPRKKKRFSNLRKIVFLLFWVQILNFDNWKLGLLS